MGKCTAGGGLITALYSLKDRTLLRLAVGESYRPNGAALHGAGICPDIDVKEVAGRSTLNGVPIAEEVRRLLIAASELF